MARLVRHGGVVCCRRCNASGSAGSVAFSLPFDALFYMAATVGSAIDHHRGRGVQWRNRRYEKAGA